MGIKYKVIGLAAVIVAVVSCGLKKGDSGIIDHDTSDGEEMLWDVEEDTLMQEEEELGLTEESSPAMDGVFNDFLFAYLHSRKLRKERTANPLRLEHSERPAEILEEFDPEFEFGFLSGEYFTTIYGNTSQMQAEDDEELEEDSIVSLQRINLNDGTIRNFLFLREAGHWQLDAIREGTFDDDELSDFLAFYARFCADSLFQSQSIADPLRVVLQDPDDEEESIDGIINAESVLNFHILKDASLYVPW